MAKKKLKIMLSSTVHHFKTEIEQIYATLTGYGYDVSCSHMGTVYNVPGKSPEDSCLIAVEECDFFFGIIYPFYGSGITHKEFKKAIEINKPRGFLAHHDVAFARQLLNQFMVDGNGDKTDFKLIKKTPVMDDLRVIEMYNDAVGDGLPLNKRFWAQEKLGHDVQVDSNSRKNRIGLGPYLHVADTKETSCIKIYSAYCPIF